MFQQRPMSCYSCLVLYIHGCRHHWRRGSSLGQLLFGTATFLTEELLKMKIFTEELPFSKLILLHSINIFRRAKFWKKASFSEKQYSSLPTFSRQLPFQRDSFFKRGYLLKQLPLRKSYFFTVYFSRRITILQLGFLSKAAFPIYQSVIK